MRAFGRGRPAAQVDAFDPSPLHHDGLAGRIGTEGSDLLALGNSSRSFAWNASPAVVRRRSPDWMRALLLGHLTREWSRTISSNRASSNHSRAASTCVSNALIAGLVVLMVPEAIARALALRPVAVRLPCRADQKTVLVDGQAKDPQMRGVPARPTTCVAVWRGSTSRLMGDPFRAAAGVGNVRWLLTHPSNRMFK